jgi:hypothetical protein
MINKYLFHLPLAVLLLLMEVTHSAATLQTLYDEVSVKWITDNNILKMDVVIPENTSAQISLPGDLITLNTAGNMILKKIIPPYLRIFVTTPPGY